MAEALGVRSLALSPCVVPYAHPAGYRDAFRSAPRLEWEKGDLKLRDVKLRKDALQKLNMPVELKSGWI